MAKAAATAAAACQHHDRRTASRVLGTPEAECNALPFELRPAAAKQRRGARPRDLRTRSSDGDSSSDSSGGVPASDDRRTVSRVLHTPEAECNALPFELGTRGI